MKRTNTIIPTLIALLAATTASQSLQAQAPARQAFPWSSSSVTGAAKTVSRASSAVQSVAQSSVQKVSGSASRTIESTNGSATKIANDVVAQGKRIYLDQQGNEISREAFEAKLGVQEHLTKVLPATQQSVQSFDHNIQNNVQQHVASLPSVDNSAWGKTKNVASKAISFWKKPTLFKTPEGLPSNKKAWGKPKFAEPSTWFSDKAESDITFAPLGSLPRKGQFPTSIDGPLHQPQIASRVIENVPRAVEAVASVPQAIETVASVPKTLISKPTSEVVGAAQSVFESAKEHVASTFNSGGDFEPRR